MTFDEWYKDFRLCGMGLEEHFTNLIKLGLFREPEDIKVYMQIAFNATLKENKQ